MADADLNEIRNSRLAEMRKQYGDGKGKDATEEAETKAREEEIKNGFLSQVLSQEARARLNTVAAAKPEKAQRVENMLMNMFRMGHIQGKLGEEELKSLLEKVSEHTQKKTTIKFDRKRNVMDDDDF